MRKSNRVKKNGKINKKLVFVNPNHKVKGMNNKGILITKNL